MATKPTLTKKARKPTDWEAVERDYRTGKFTLRELGEKHGATHTTIARRAEKQQWPKDLTAAIRQATNARVIQETVQQHCTNAQQSATSAVLVAAQVAANVILGQQSRVKTATEVAMRMLEELDMTTSGAEGIRTAFEKLTEDADAIAVEQARNKLSDLLRLHSRVGSVHKLMDAINKAQEMERKVFRLDDGADKPPSMSDMSDDELMARLARFGVQAELPKAPT